ncbi:hypothetical protein HanXRQr2_Chr04g0140881 [Helianthus annuus]|uniref:Arabidopsis retrotransposon Orf1 C-terminal domain-containing protein n=1 Tax=Helianthus annuus TaxID=4232 RepID=A0A9K3NPI8_HELAN|nr:hypothetical protein HanXRQr2_Chr04g0140881 [Helianthus annuus]KAJ0929366.1 hypothetical protein HanPSC8_Chr04g0136851 [Helianthus annuus]
MFIYFFWMDLSDEEIEHIDEGVEGGEEEPECPYLQFPVGSRARGRCARLRTIPIGEHVGIDWELLATVGEIERAREIVGLDTPWSRLFQLAMEDSYPELTYEFCSTFTYAPHPADYVEDPLFPVHEVTFRLAGQQFEMSVREFAVHTGLYTEPELDTDLYTQAVTMMDRQTLISFWRAISRVPFGKSWQKATTIVDPLYRYLHQVIASTIVPRGSSKEKVNLSDLFFLYCLLRRQLCDLAASLAEYFATAYHRQLRGFLHTGSFITAIARSLGIVPELDPLLSDPVPSSRLGRASVSAMQITRTFDFGLRFRGADGLIFQPVELPEVIPVVIEARPGILAPPDVQQAARRAQRRALGIDEPEDQPEGQAQAQAQAQPQPQAQDDPAQEDRVEEVHVPPVEPAPEPPQYPQHVYADLPPVAREVARDFDRRLRRQGALIEWMVETLVELRELAALPPRPLPPSPPHED